MIPILESIYYTLIILGFLDCLCISLLGIMLTWFTVLELISKFIDRSYNQVIAIRDKGLVVRLYHQYKQGKIKLE